MKIFDRINFGSYGYITPWTEFTNLNIGLSQGGGTLSLEIHKDLNGQAYIAGFIQQKELNSLLETNNKGSWTGLIRTSSNDAFISPVILLREL